MEKATDEDTSYRESDEPPEDVFYIRIDVYLLSPFPRHRHPSCS
jgi:hypothetical protein